MIVFLICGKIIDNMDYIKISKEAVGYLYKSHATLRHSEIDVKLIALAELRVSQINGCAYCCSFHANELREFGYDQHFLEKAPHYGRCGDII